MKQYMHATLNMLKKMRTRTSCNLTWIACVLVINLFCMSLIDSGALLCHATPDTAAPPACDDGVYFSRSVELDARTALRAAFHVHGDVDDVYRTLRDAERFPEFMPGTHEVIVLEDSAEFQIVSFKGGRGLFATEVVLRRTSDDQQRRISWSLVRGSLKSSDGFWSVEPDTHCGTALVTYFNIVDAKLPLPARVIHSFLRRNIEETAECLRQRVASNGMWQSDTYLKRRAKSR
jgi:ribosome-associated toxin RatA of RatAB toxin-antitoxin module